MSELENATTSLNFEHTDIEKNLDRLYKEKDQLIKEEEQRARERLHSAEIEEESRRKAMSEEIKKEDEIRSAHNKEM